MARHGFARLLLWLWLWLWLWLRHECRNSVNSVVLNKPFYAFIQYVFYQRNHAAPVLSTATATPSAAINNFVS